MYICIYVYSVRFANHRRPPVSGSLEFGTLCLHSVEECYTIDLRHFGSILAAIWLQVGHKLVPNWLQVGPSWPQVGPKLASSWGWDQVGPSWGQVEPSWDQVGPSWVQVRAKLEPKMEPKSIKKWSKN